MVIHFPNRCQVNHHKSVKQSTAKVSNKAPQKCQTQFNKNVWRFADNLSKYTARNMSLDYTISNGIMQGKRTIFSGESHSMNHQQSDLIEWVQLYKVFEFAVVHRAGGIVDIVVGDDDLFDEVIDPSKSKTRGHMLSLLQRCRQLEWGKPCYSSQRGNRSHALSYVVIPRGTFAVLTYSVDGLRVDKHDIPIA